MHAASECNLTKTSLQLYQKCLLEVKTVESMSANGSLYLSLKPKFETKNRFQTEVKPKHKVTLSFGFKVWFETKLWFQTLVSELRSPVSNQTIVMYFDRQLSLNT